MRLGQYVYNVTPSTVTKYSPFQLLFGRIPIDNVTGLHLNPVYTFEDYYDQLRSNIKSANEAARNIALEKRKSNRDKINQNSKTKSFSPGEDVLVKNFAASGLQDKFERAEVVQDLSPQHV